METAVVVRGVANVVRDLGFGTNCDAEWLALIAALKIALELDLPEFVLLGDSAVVVAQARREQPCRGADLQRHFASFAALIGGEKWPRVRKIARAQNLAGIVLSQAHER